MTGLLLAILLIALPAGFGLWHLAGGVAAVWRRHAAETAVTGLRLRVIWRDDPAPDLFRLWLVGWPFLLPRFSAGQHVVVSVPLPDGRLAKRAYSLAAWHRFPLWYCLAIRKGTDASAVLHRSARPLTRWPVSAPRGHFTDPDPRAPLLMVAGGIGVTPFRALVMQRAAQPWAAPVTLHQTARTVPELLWRAALTQLSARYCGFRYIPRATATQARLTAADILARTGPETHVMICAGDSLTSVLSHHLLAAGLPTARLHVEAFSLALPPEDLGITITMGSHSFRPGRIGSLLEALERGSIAPDSECRSGECSLCSVEILQGRVRDIATGHPVTGRVLACSVIPETDITLRHLA